MWVFILIHLSLALFLVAVGLWKKRISERFLSAWLIFLLFPVGGALICWVLTSYHTGGDQAEVIENPGSFSKREPVFELIEPLNVLAETNIASLEETLLIADYGKRREVVLNLLKEGVSDHASYINLALHNEDSETAHYAASGILHTKRKLDTNLSYFSEIYRNDSNDLTVALTYADLLNQYLTTVPMDATDKLFYTFENIHVLEKIVEKSESVNTSHLARLIDLLLEIEDFNRANKYCYDLREKYADTEEKFLVLLKSYFIMKDKENFEKIFRKFRDSDIYFSSETMHVIRLWLGTVDAFKNVYHNS